ncbi:MAG: hypothetical protein ABH950_01350 [Candidatus Altiarchaeota archaeon]
MTVELENNRIYRGKGVFKIEGKECGILEKINFVHSHVGFGGDNTKSFYGTVTGKVDDLYAARHRRLDIEANVAEVNKEGAKPFHVIIHNVEFIDELPKTGILKQLEFHGEKADLDEV